MATEVLGACPRNVSGAVGWFIKFYRETAVMCPPQLALCQTDSRMIRSKRIKIKKGIHTSLSPDLQVVSFGILVWVGSIASTKLGGVSKDPRSYITSRSASWETALELVVCEELEDSSLTPP